MAEQEWRRTNVSTRKQGWDRVLAEIRHAIGLFAKGSASAAVQALRGIVKHRKAILLTSWKGVKMLLLILAISAAPDQLKGALERLEDIVGD